jgi:hypothetical protein
LEAPSTLISYSHDSASHCDRVLTLANRLVEDGIDVRLDQYEPYPPDGWLRWMENQIADGSAPNNRAMNAAATTFPHTPE